MRTESRNDCFQAVIQDSGVVSQGTEQIDASESDSELEMTYNLPEDDAANDQVAQIWEEHRQQLQQQQKTQTRDRRVRNSKIKQRFVCNETMKNPQNVYLC